MATLEEQVGIIEQQLYAYQQLIHDYKNSAYAMKQAKIAELEQQQQAIDRQIIYYKEIQRYTPVISNAVRTKYKQLTDLYQALKQDLAFTRRQYYQSERPDYELRERAMAVNAHYSAQTSELKDINRKVEEGVMRIRANQEKVMQQDQQLDNVGYKFNQIYAKAETAGKLVNQMRRNDQKCTIGLKYIFLILLAADIIFALIVGVREVRGNVGRTSFGTISKAFIPHLPDVRNINGQRTLIVANYYDEV